MATRIFTTSLTTVGTNITLAGGENLFVGPLAVRASSAGLGISAQALSELNILGTIYGDIGGIVLGASALLPTNGSIFVGADGAVLSPLQAIVTRGENITITNSGEVRGSTGVEHTGARRFVLNNTGLIVGTDVAAVSASGWISLINTGSILGEGASGINIVGSTSNLVVSNFGTISASNAGFGRNAIVGSQLQDSIQNNGRVEGGVDLRDGNDIYDGRLGTVDQVSGGNGADTLRGGVGNEVLDGGTGDDFIHGGGGDDRLRGLAGIDTLDGGEGNDVIEAGSFIGGLSRKPDVYEGGAGRDRLDYTGASSFEAVSVDLATGEASGYAAGDEFSGFEDLAGGAGNDTLAGDGFANGLFGNAGADLLLGAAGNDVLVGGAGFDTLVGGSGIDVLRGGFGTDVFRFLAPADSGAPGQVRDRIIDFSQAEGDRIDLSFIDADTALAGDQAFVLVQAGFTAAGQVRTQQIGGNTFVFANTDANPATAEFSILLFGTHALVAADFIL